MPPTSPRDTALYSAAVLLGVLMAIAAFVSPAGAWPLAAAALACVAIANLDRFQELSAGASGVKAVLREAKTELVAMREVVEVLAEYQLSLMQQVGRWRDRKDEEKTAAVARIVALMKKAGIPPERIAEIKDGAWDRYVMFDYVMAILGGGLIPNTKDPKIHERWKEMRNVQRIPTVAELTSFLDEVGDLHPLRRQLLSAYEHYREKREHVDLALWSERDKVPQLLSDRTLP